MKVIGITILIYIAILIIVVYTIVKMYKEILEDKDFEFEIIIDQKDEEIRILKQKLEEARDNEKISRRIANMNTSSAKEEYSKIVSDYQENFNKKLNRIEEITKSYGNPVLALSQIKSIIKELSTSDQTVR